MTYEWICVDFKSLSVVISDSPVRLPFFCWFFYGQIKEGFFFYFLNKPQQQRAWCQPLPFFYLFIFFSSSLGERGETSPRWHPPSCGNGFPGPLLCQLLAAVVLQSKRCRNPFFGQCLWLRMLPPLCVHVRVCVCVCVTERKIGCG